MKLILKNKNNNTIEFSEDSAFTLTKIAGIGDVETNLYTTKSPNQDGETYLGNTLKSRDIHIEISIVADSKENMLSKRKEIMGVVNSKLEILELTYINGNKQIKIKGILENLNFPYEDNFEDNMQKVLIDIYCPSSYLQSIEPFKNDMAVFVGKFEFPLEIPINEGILFGEQGEKIIITNNSDAETPVKIEFNGPAENPKVTNLTTGEYILVDRVIGAEQKLVIDTDIENVKVEIHDENGYVENAFHWIDLGSTFWQLQRGENEIKYEADVGMDTAIVKIEHHERYVGI